jgi:murein DD-endopeptidase MepM/ murein hydrolase activator NlpD
LSEKINFHRSLKSGDRFEVLYSQKNEMLYSKISTKRAEIAVYKVQSGKTSSYYFSNGEKANQVVAGTHFGSPLAGKLLISDNYGYRVHPITGKYHYHTGVDLRASYGSPVYAVYGGVVTRSSYYAGYGNCVDIRHPQGYSSRYAHLSRFAVHHGKTVKKGDVIGYIGSTGTSTGAHLHLEMAKNNRIMNPLSVKIMPTVSGVVQDRRKFDKLKRKIGNLVSAH